MKSCKNCYWCKNMTQLLGNTNCDLICGRYSSNNKKWIINFPIFRAILCQMYLPQDCKDNCFSYCKNHGTMQCPTSIACLAKKEKPYFKAHYDI